MLCLSLVLHISQGALAGISLMQTLTIPWVPQDPECSLPQACDPSLAHHLAYGLVSVTTQRALSVFAGLSFLAACDRHVANPRPLTRLVLLLYACAVLTVVLCIPTDLALHLGRASRLPALAEHLAAAGSEPAAYTPHLINATQIVDEGGGPFSPKLSLQQLGWWQVLVAARLGFSLLGWVLCSLVESSEPFQLPPLPTRRRNPARSVELGVISSSRGR